MPQIRLEYTANLLGNINFRELFSEVHKALNETAGIAMMNCKSRAIKLDDYFVGDGGDEHAFVHLEIAILEGRTEYVKKEIANKALQILKKYFMAGFNKNDLQITVEIKDINRDFYFKYPEGTLSKI